MRDTVDAFIEAVEQARRQLIRDEGRNVSMREVIRRAGYDESERSGIAYHLNPNIDRSRGHKVPADIVRRLAAVLPISEEDLARAAQVAAGYNVVLENESPDLPVIVARFYEDASVSDEEKQKVTADLLRILSDEARRQKQRDPRSDET